MQANAALELLTGLLHRVPEPCELGDLPHCLISLAQRLVSLRFCLCHASPEFLILLCLLLILASDASPS